MKRRLFLILLSVSLLSQETQAWARLEFDSPPAEEDPFSDRQGPFYHDVYLTRSADGLNFSAGELVLKQASVPDVIRLPSGEIAVYAVDGARQSRSGIMVAISKDEGKSWERGSLQFRGKGGGADPEAVLLSDGRVRLYYVRFSSRTVPGESPQGMNEVRSAISDEGFYFEEEEGVRFMYQAITDPDVVRIGNRWYMYLAQGPALIAASSLDGLHFTDEGPVRPDGSVSNTVEVGPGLWRQYYCADGKIRSAVTQNGMNWRNEEGARLYPSGDEIICDPAPLMSGNEWLLFYKAAPRPKFNRRDS